MLDESTFRIRPAGRHIFTIGRDLIQDPYAAVVEIVKNSFDADSLWVNIAFFWDKKTKRFEVEIEDGGHGMARSDVIDRWLVPSSDNKLTRRQSPGGRQLQGKKGIGRYSTSILGDDLLLETTDGSGCTTTVYVEWIDFEKADFLGDVEIAVETETTNNSPGTKLTMSGGEERLREWDETQFRKLRQELKKLKSPPIETPDGNAETDTFDIILTVSGFRSVDDFSETVEPYPLSNLYDYRVSGVIGPDGKGSIEYLCQKESSLIRDEIEVDFSSDIVVSCGAVTFDIRVYDRDAKGIDQLIGRGLKDADGNYVGKREARRILDANNGLGVYRGGFRIRPLGDANYDWLELNKKRIQNPSRKISDNQVLGFVHIESEDRSGLEEKSARDGLRENAAFVSLKTITSNVIAILEERRYIYRRSMEPRAKIEQQLQTLFRDSELKKEIGDKLTKSGVSDTTISSIEELLDRDAQLKSRAYERISRAVAIYQDQASLGKIMNVVVHEGRRPLNFFKNQIKNLKFFFEEYEQDPTPRNLEKVIPIAEGFRLNAEVFVNLFSRLDPLASGKRAKQKSIDLERLSKNAFEIFEQQIESDGVEVSIAGPSDFRFLGWEQDFYAILTNLVDNSLFWMRNARVEAPKISIVFQGKEGMLEFLDYRDTGPGISKHHIESEVIFEPDFSTKPGEQSGLGLAIAGEAASRNGLEFRAFESSTGAYFRLQPNTEETE